ncbi:dihydrofolate reductase family protein [Clostridium tarantellae]|uniref:Dihydrofolate reductase n=1 Tax=Clostridium tarantellae TaxID=39493 RepID=A0A6I1MPJ4_9CLOT|nr:dihydrofolate reductase family protein [Clostridium tarantellae]MPQ44388.1 dihydrofolate reductase [Clostridium tarantellae]
MGRRVILYIAMSLDGYIARENGAIDWLLGDGSEPEADYGYADFYRSIDTVIIGRKTYDQIVNELSPNKWVYKGKKSYVFTNSDYKRNDDVEFIKEDVCDFVNKLKEKKGKDIWILGGSSLADRLIKENLIDDYIISIMPTILGNGIQLFNKNNPEIKLKLKSVKSYNGSVLMHHIRREEF